MVLNRKDGRAFHGANFPVIFVVTALASALVSLQGSAAPTAALPVRVERVAFAMGTRLSVVTEGAAERGAQAAAERAVAEVERVERLLSTWDPRTPMSALNAAPPHTPSPAPPEVVHLLAEVERWARATGRAFEPTVGPLVDAWDLRGRGRLPSAAELSRALASVGAHAFDIDVEAGTVTRRTPDAWIDTGAFGKGAALRSAARLLRRAGQERAFVDLGGQVLALAGVGSAPWEVEVAHPSRRGESAAKLVLRGVSAATSGTSERWVEVGGQRLGHLLDPRTGRPVEAWGSVTVVSEDALVADALSTALYVLGPDDGLAWARSRTDVGVLFLEERDGRVVPSWNPAMETWLDPSSIRSKHPDLPIER